MSAISSAPGAQRLLVISILARLPLVMLSIGLLVHTEHLTGSFAAAGAVTGVYAIALAVGGPLLGRLVDSRGQRVVLLASAAAAALLLVAIAALPAGAPLRRCSGSRPGSGSPPRRWARACAPCCRRSCPMRGPCGPRTPSTPPRAS